MCNKATREAQACTSLSESWYFFQMGDPKEDWGRETSRSSLLLRKTSLASLLEGDMGEQQGSNGEELEVTPSHLCEACQRLLLDCVRPCRTSERPDYLEVELTRFATRLGEIREKEETLR